MQQENQKGKLVTLTLRDTTFHNVCHSMNLSQYANTYPMIFGACRQLLEEYFEPIGYRYIGVHIGSLKDVKQIVEQIDLFEAPQENTDFILRTCCVNRKVPYDGRPVKEILTGNAELNATIPETILDWLESKCG